VIATDRFIASWKADGYRFVGVPEMMRDGALGSASTAGQGK
jgi:hypothetical protein